MRVAVLLPGFCADENDWCIPVITNFVRAMARHVEVVVFTPHYPYRRSIYQIHGLTVHCLSDEKKGGAGRLLLWRELRRRMRAEHERAPFDLIHPFWATEIGFLGTWIAAGLGIPCVVSLAGGEMAELREAGYGARLSRRESFFVRRSLRGASALTSGSKWLTRKVPSEYGGKLTTIPLGVDADMFAPGAIRAGHRLLASASVSRVKDYPTLLRALAIVRRIFPDVTLTSAGYQMPDVLPGLQRLARDLGIDEVIDWRGVIAHDEMPALYHSHDLLVHSSLYEAQGMAILEALATGMPVVASEVGIVESLPEDLVHRVRPGSPEMLAEKTIASLASRDHARRAFERGPGLVREGYSIEGAVESFLEVYVTVTGGSGVSAVRARSSASLPM